MHGASARVRNSSPELLGVRTHLRAPAGRESTVLSSTVRMKRSKNNSVHDQVVGMNAEKAVGVQVIYVNAGVNASFLLSHD